MKKIKINNNMKKIKSFESYIELLENNRIPKKLYLKLKKISNGVLDNISGSKAEDIFNELNDDELDDLIMSYWDESVDFSNDNIEKVKELIGNIEDINPYW